MQEEVIEELLRKVAGLEENFEKHTGVVEQLRIIQQRRSEEIRSVRLESKSYGAEILDKLEAMQDQMNDRFEGAHERMDKLTTAVETLVSLLGNALKDRDPDTKQPGE